jgi:hypothetical protein
MPKPLKDNDSVVVPRQTDTGVAKRVASMTDVFRDSTRSTTSHPQGDVERLPWRERRQDGNWLYITKAWRNFFNRKRVLAVFAYPIRDDGTLGRRVRLHHRVNGKPPHAR